MHWSMTAALTGMSPSYWGWVRFHYPEETIKDMLKDVKMSLKDKSKKETTKKD